MAQTRIFLAGVLLALALTGCGRPPPLLIASHVWPGYEPMFLARELGWLDPGRAYLVETGSASESLKALHAGRVDGAALTLDEVLSVRASGLAVTVVLVFNVSSGADALIARPPVSRLEDLRGRRVGYEHGAVGTLVMMEALRRAGLEPDDVYHVNLPADDHIAAWEAGLVDAVVTFEPRASRLRDLDGVTLFDSREIPNTIVDVLVMRSDRLGPRRTRDVRHLVSAHFRALEYFRRNPQDAAYRMAPRLGLAPQAVAQAYRGIVLPDAENNHRLMHGAEAPLMAKARLLKDLMVDLGMLHAGDDLVQLMDPAYLPAAGR